MDLRYINIGAAAVGSILGGLFGGLDGFLYALLVFMVIDYITGLLAAGVEKELDSRVGFKGIAKKVAILLLVVIAHTLDARVIGSGAVARTTVIFFYLSNEGLSIIENASRIGLPVPAKLKSLLEQLKDKEDKHEQENEQRAG